MIDANKPVELYNPTTGEVKDAKIDRMEGVNKNLFVVSPPVTVNGWVNYELDGSPRINGNPWYLRNKGANMLDLTKPLELSNGIPAKVTYDYSRRDDNRYWSKHVDVIIDGVLRSFSYHDGLIHFAFPGLTLRNKETNMLDLNKPLTVNGKDAKVIHKFDNGNLAVVVDGETNVWSFHSNGSYINGAPTSAGWPVLKNKVVETVRYLNIDPSGGYCNIHPTFDRAKNGRSDEGLACINGCRIKQTLIDGKVVKSEIIA